jgi:hypothetical protein
MKWLRFFFVIIALSLEVRVKAFQQEPQSCLSNSGSPCSLFTKRPQTLQAKKFSVSLAAGSILYRDRADAWNFVTGTLRFKTSASTEIQTKVGRITLFPGIHWVQWREESLWVYSIEGFAEVKLQSSPLRVNVVPQGFYNWFGLIDHQGLNEQGVPRELTQNVVKSFLPGMSKHADLGLVAKGEDRAIANAAEFYKDIAQHVQDQVELREQRLERDRNARIEEERRMRQMFRQKYLGPVEFDEDSMDSQN